MGAPASPSGSRPSDQAPSGLAAPRVDPSRDDNGCPYDPTNERSIDQAMAWHEGYRAALRWMMETPREERGKPDARDPSRWQHVLEDGSIDHEWVTEFGATFCAQCEVGKPEE